VGGQCFNNNKKVLEEAANKNKGRVLWQTDGLTPEINSLAVIIDWLTKEGNYNQWRGGDKQNGMTKVGIENEISQIIKDKGITLERQGRAIDIKTNRLEQQFWAATDWLSQKGAGVTCEERIRAAVKQMCLHIYKLVEVMSDRASTTPLSTILSIKPQEIIDCEVSGIGVDNKPAAVDTPSIKQTAEDVPSSRRSVGPLQTAFCPNNQVISVKERVDDPQHQIQRQTVRNRRAKAQLARKIVGY